jgi:hypothetical protein
LVLGIAPLVLMRFSCPRYAVGRDTAEICWCIERGLLVAATGRGTGALRIRVDRDSHDAAERAVVRISVEVRDFHPRLRGKGRATRAGTWLYRRTQLRCHVWQARRFLGLIAP